MNILEFTSKFPDEKSCITYLKELREKQGLECKRCGEVTKQWWFEKIKQFSCSVCDSRTSLRGGTMMEKSKIPLRLWFTCIHLMTTTKKPFSALEMKRQLGLNRYEPVWYMMTKIRLVMGKRDERYKLKGHIEVDDAFFEVNDLPKKDILGNPIKPNYIVTKTLKAGRGSQRQAKVLVMVESTPVQHNDKHRKKRSMGYIKMIVMDNLSSDEIRFEVRRCIDFESTVYTDGFKSYNDIEGYVRTHKKEVVKASEAMEKLPWVHTVISNAKRQFLGTHHSIGREFLQGYLNEFCYKLNRRNFIYRDLFDSMVIAGSNDVWYREAA